jgi:ubiquinone/menaquinone biosynthesis C-methylase UbiE
MPDHKKVYASEAEQYEALVAREDYQQNIERALDGIVRVDGLDVIDLGAGTGRLSGLLARRTRSTRAFDISHHMLTVTRDKFRRLPGGLNLAAAADHRFIPAASASADVVLSGWSVSYLAVWNPDRWREQLDGWLTEVKRVLRPGGYVILFESLGTGNASPEKLEHLADFYPWLDETGFHYQWIRTDYKFASPEEAAELAGFFFGEEMGRRVRDENLVILPECTGVWWRKRVEDVDRAA